MTGILAPLGNPDSVILVLLCGILLIYVECNRPGAVLPGSLGALLSLLGVFGLSHMPLRPSGLVLLAGGLALLLAELWVSTRFILPACGIAALTWGLATLVDTGRIDRRIHLPVAIFASIVFGVVTLALARVALRARRNKLTPRSIAAG